MRAPYRFGFASSTGQLPIKAFIFLALFLPSSVRP